MKKQRDIEALRVYRPVACGQVKDTLEAWVVGVVDIVMGVDLLPPHSSKMVWSGQ